MKKVLALGVFDMFHVGHLNYLQAAASLGDYLIVGVQDSRAVREGKNVEPTIATAARHAIVGAIKGVSEVFTYMEPDHVALLKHYKPNILAVGQEFGHDHRFPYQKETIEWAKENGVEVKWLPRTTGVSSTELRRKSDKFWEVQRPANLTQQFTEQQTEEEANAIVAICPQLASYVELGCADGRLTKALSGKVRMITGIDQSSVMIQRARENLRGTSNVYLHECDAEAAFKFVKAQVVIFSGICPYLPDQDLLRLIWVVCQADPKAILFREPLGISSDVEVTEQIIPDLGCTYSAYYRHASWIQNTMRARGWSCYHSSVIRQHHPDTALKLLGFK